MLSPITFGGALAASQRLLILILVLEATVSSAFSPQSCSWYLVASRHNSFALSESTIDAEYFQSVGGNQGLGAWVPIGSKTALQDICPTRVKVMGVNLVVWNGDENEEKEETTYSVMKDVCSHRLAPLSQGRVDRESGCIECPYHGWQFNTEGKLTCIPQFETKIENDNLPSSLVEKASVESYPVHVTGDLIWAFLPTSVHGESFPRDMLPENYYHNGLTRDVQLNTNFAVLELPASYDFFMENVMDPSHLSFAHHGVIGRREDAGPVKIDLQESNFTHVSFQTEYKRKGESRTRIFGIQRPFNFFTLEKDASDWSPGAVAFFVPIEEGRVRFITSLGNSKLATLPLPNWMIHLLTMKLTEGDTILHDTELAARCSVSDATEQYITPTSADKGVLAFRRWWRKFGLSESPPNTFGPASAGSLRQMSRDEYTNPWRIHTQSCSACRRALRRAKRVRKWSLLAGVLAALGTNILKKPVISMPAAFLGLMSSSAANKVVWALEGSPNLSDVSDRSIPLD